MSEQNKNSGPVFHLLSKLDPGRKVDRVFINGKRESVEAFASVNPATGLATFSKSDGDVLVVDYRRIDAIQLG